MSGPTSVAISNSMACQRRPSLRYYSIDIDSSPPPPPRLTPSNGGMQDSPHENGGSLPSHTSYLDARSSYSLGYDATGYHRHAVPTDRGTSIGSSTASASSRNSHDKYPFNSGISVKKYSAPLAPSVSVPVSFLFAPVDLSSHHHMEFDVGPHKKHKLQAPSIPESAGTPRPILHNSYLKREELSRSIEGGAGLHATTSELRERARELRFIDDDDSPYRNKDYPLRGGTLPAGQDRDDHGIEHGWLHGQSVTTSTASSSVQPQKASGKLSTNHTNLNIDEGHNGDEEIEEVEESHHFSGSEDEAEEGGECNWGCSGRDLAHTPSSSLRSTLVVRQQPSLRVRAIIDRLTHMSGRDQRRALFSLKSIFQNDKDLVHEFVQNDGLECLVKLGRQSDQNHQNHILRAIGQLMLYVDGMNGVIVHTDTIRWLYELLDSPVSHRKGEHSSSHRSALYNVSEVTAYVEEFFTLKYRLVVKTSLKLLLVFVEYTESNSLLLLAVVNKAERGRNRQDWHSIMRILNERQASDEETLVYAMTVINKTLSGIPDQDTFFDVVDVLESQGIEDALEEMLKLNNQQLTQQCMLYENELKREDAVMAADDGGVESQLVKMRLSGTSAPPPPAHLQSTAITGVNGGSIDRRSLMRRRQNEAEEIYRQQSQKPLVNKFEPHQQEAVRNGSTVAAAVAAAKHQQQSLWRRPISAEEDEEEMPTEISKFSHAGQSNGAPVVKEVRVEEKENLNEDLEVGDDHELPHQMKAPPPSIPTNIFSPTEAKTMEFPTEPTEKTPETPPPPPPSEPKAKTADSDDEAGAGGGFAALLQKRAKKMESGAFRKGLLLEHSSRPSESEVKWKEAAEKLKEKPMIINDLDFSAFDEFEQDPLVLVKVAEVAQERGLLPGGGGGGSRGGPGMMPAPPAPPPLPGGAVPPPPPPGAAAGGACMRARESSPGPSGSNNKASAMKLLHWKVAQAEAPPVPALRRKGTFWNQIEGPQIDASKLVKLFEQKAKETVAKKPGTESKPQVLQVLSVKRSQAINIGLTKLPPVTVIPTAIKKFDATVLNKEGIEKILTTMMPSLEEVERIRERQAENPDTPMGPAEQFLLSLSEIDCLLERLRLWLFMLDYHNVEKDVAESLMELNNAMKEVEESQTFRVSMGMLLNIGNTLNGTDIKAFQLEYLSRASELKDPVHKYSLTHHLAEYMLDHYPQGSDLYTELGAVSRCSRLDFDAVQDNLKKMESDCKACFDYVARISQKDNNSSMKAKVNQFLTEVAERIHRLKHVHRTTTHRWNAFLIYFGYSPNEVREQKPTAVFKMVIEFALEYRTNRDKILQMRKRMAEKRERNKTRGMMIGAVQSATSVGSKVARRPGDVGKAVNDRERHQEMSRLLTSNKDDAGTLSRRRGQPTPERTLIAAQTEALRRSPGTESPDDELLDGVVRTVTAQTDSRDQSRRRARLFNRKSLRRTRTIRQDQLAELNNMNNY